MIQVKELLFTNKHVSLNKSETYIWYIDSAQIEETLVAWNKLGFNTNIETKN